MEHQAISGKQGSIHNWVTGQSNRCIMLLLELRWILIFSIIKSNTSPNKGFSLQRAATKLIKILDAEKIRKAHLVGQSMGGYKGGFYKQIRISYCKFSIGKG
jgi:pimeloyl-ACP methyl ester carboxylesterase